MTDPIYRTVFQVEVFSRGPLHDASNDYDPFGLAGINYLITEGDCIGDVAKTRSEPVPDDQLVAELIRIGNDGTFFNNSQI